MKEFFYSLTTSLMTGVVVLIIIQNQQPRTPVVKLEVPEMVYSSPVQTLQARKVPQIVDASFQSIDDEYLDDIGFKQDDSIDLISEFNKMEQRVSDLEAKCGVGSYSFSSSAPVSSPVVVSSPAPVMSQPVVYSSPAPTFSSAPVSSGGSTGYSAAASYSAPAFSQAVSAPMFSYSSPVESFATEQVFMSSGNSDGNGYSSSRPRNNFRYSNRVRSDGSVAGQPVRNFLRACVN